ncbi:MAG: SUMF1/EgtB/PvdO family nonheme iron enzyme [Bacteroidota bacterium]
MSRHLFTILSFLLVITIDNCCAQELGQGKFKNPDAKKTTAAKTQHKTTVSKSEKPKPMALILTTNEDCMVRIGEANFSLRRGEKKTIPLTKGTYTVTATSTQGNYRYATEVGIVDTDVALQVDLAKVITAERIKLDSAAREKEREKVATASPPPPVKKNVVEPDEKPKMSATTKAAVDALFSNMVSIGAGSFTMGNNLGDNDEGPEHTVNIRAFKFSKYEVTQQQWEAVMGTNPSANHGCANCPVENINFTDIDSFINKISRISSRIFRLPSEAEWEYVAKKGGVFKDIADRAWYNNNSGKVTKPVGTKGPNALGIFDMAGNVAEWCRDWYSGSYYKKKPADNPAGPDSGEKKVVRGGAYNDSENTLRPSHRDKQNSDTRKQTTGLRLVMD